MKRVIALLLICLMSFSLFAADTKKNTVSPVKYEYEPYDKDEFADWTMELRRAETIFFGSFVITLPLSMLAYNAAIALGAPKPDSTSTAFLYQLAGAAGLSLVITGVDWILGL